MEQYEAVLDRIEDGKFAVILAESLNKEFVIDVSLLPEGSKEGTWFKITIQDDQIEQITIDEAKTKEKLKTINEKLNLLRQKKSSSKFKRN